MYTAKQEFEKAHTRQKAAMAKTTELETVLKAALLLKSGGVEEEGNDVMVVDSEDEVEIFHPSISGRAAGGVGGSGGAVAKALKGVATLCTGASQKQNAAPMGVQGAQGESATAQVPTPWKKYTGPASNKPFYHNSVTEQVQWNPPH